MPFIEVNHCQIYYESFGQDHPDRAPLILIHGSTQTGRSCWGLAAALLGEHFRAIVPDCRGHGQSANPGRSYSFKELADDTAGLVKALGYPRAHIIGHSNGGNVALVTLLEHPEIVQSAVLQAANAYVSPDLVEKEPDVFDPERVAREAPGWKDEMIALHGPTHGQDYWRDLLAWTVQEIISAPNYTPADLAKVERPTLVIQGENDRVNAPAGHAQFIAAHIPFAERWLPANTGHNVQNENLFAWIERVLEFLTQRGDDLNNALYCLKRSQYPDERVTIFQPHAEFATSADQPRKILLTGRVLTSGAHRQAVQLVENLTTDPVRDEIAILLENAPWALVKRPVNDLRREPSIRAERVSQALLGEAVQILQTGPEWSLVRLEKDAYLGWLQNAAMAPCPKDTLRAYQQSCNARVQAELLPARVVASAHAAPGEFSGKIPFGALVAVADFQDDTADLRMPDGTIWRVASTGVLAEFHWPSPNEEGIRAALKLIRRFIGVPYLWGGRTPFGYDCSGLAQTFWNFLGVSIPRDADQQFQAGKPVEGPTQPGDLLFFGEADQWSGGRFANISHVAIALGGTEFIHANSPAWGVSVNSLEPASTLYRPWLADNLAGARRFV